MALSSLPNALTITRIVTVAPLVWLMWTGHYLGALAVAMLAGLTDVLDGYLARRFSWQSHFGGWADPAADKLLMSAAYITLALLGALPVWLSVLVIGRDIIIAAGALMYRKLFGQFNAQPTLWSKATTFTQVLLIWMKLVVLAGFGLPSVFFEWMVVVVSALTVSTLIQYMWLWGHRAVRAGQTIKGES